MDTNYSRQAFDLLENGQYEDAGNHYTQAAYLALGRDAITDAADHQIGAGLERLLRAALCYRQAGLPDRCRNRCRQGTLIATDLQKRVVDDRKREAVLQEYVADFRALGAIDGADEAYQEALDGLADADLEYTICFHSCPIADKIIGFSRYIVQYAEHEPDDDLELPYDFAGRVSYKRREMDSVVRSLDR